MINQPPPAMGGMPPMDGMPPMGGDPQQPPMGGMPPGMDAEEVGEQPQFPPADAAQAWDMLDQIVAMIRENGWKRPSGGGMTGV